MKSDFFLLLPVFLESKGRQTKGKKSVKILNPQTTDLDQIREEKGRMYS